MSDETASNAAAKPRSSWSSWLSPLGTSTASTDAPVSNPTELTQPSAAVTGNAESKSEMDGAGAPPDIAGTWQKDEGASDQNSYAEQVKMLHMSSLYTYAALHYMWGLDISTDDAGFTKKYLVKNVPAYIFSEVEKFQFDEQTSMGRRDRRSGSQTATASKRDELITVDINWGEPYSGTVKEEYAMPSPQVLHITSTLTMGDRTVTALQVYNKK